MADSSSDNHDICNDNTVNNNDTTDHNDINDYHINNGNNTTHIIDNDTSIIDKVKYNKCDDCDNNDNKTDYNDNNDSNATKDKNYKNDISTIFEELPNKNLPYKLIYSPNLHKINKTDSLKYTFSWRAGNYFKKSCLGFKMKPNKCAKIFNPRWSL